VVEDDPLLLEISARMLSGSGFEVTAAADGAAAWQALNNGSYDLLLTDNNMPEVSGLELLKKLHAARRVLPAIMATGTLPHEELAAQPWLQPAATLLKPYTAEEMVRVVKKVLREADSSADGSQLLI
jgi:CheY-like chemotaxis protein